MNMLMDIFQFVDMPRGLVTRIGDLIEVRPLQKFNGEEGILMNPFKYEKPELRRRVEATVRKFKEVSVYHSKGLEIKPTYLGSSYNPPQRNSKTTKQQAIELMSVGYTPAEIAQEFRGFTKMQLAAFKAWETMTKKRS
mgnify:FL=1